LAHLGEMRGNPRGAARFRGSPSNGGGGGGGTDRPGTRPLRSRGAFQTRGGIRRSSPAHPVGRSGVWERRGTCFRGTWVNTGGSPITEPPSVVMHQGCLLVPVRRRSVAGKKLGGRDPKVGGGDLLHERRSPLFWFVKETRSSGSSKIPRCTPKRFSLSQWGGPLPLHWPWHTTRQSHTGGA